MALSEQELDLARRVKEQGGTQADFLEILEQKQQQQQPIEQPTQDIPQEANLWKIWVWLWASLWFTPPVEEDLSGFDLWVKASKWIQKFGQALQPFAKKDEAPFLWVIERGEWLSASWKESIPVGAAQFAANLPWNLIEFGWDIANLISDPITPAKSLRDIGKGILNKAIWFWLSSGISAGWASEKEVARVKQDFASGQESQMVDAIGRELKKIATDPEELQKIIVTNPTDVILTLSWIGNILKVSKVKTVADLWNRLSKITPLSALKTEWKLVSWIVKTPFKVTASTIRWITPEGIAKSIAGIDNDTAKVLKNTRKPELDAALKQAQESVDDIWNIPSPFAKAWTKAEEALDVLKIQKRTAGATKWDALKWISGTDVEVWPILDKFDDLLADRFNLAVWKDWKLQWLSGKIPKSADELQAFTDALNELRTTPNGKINLENLDALVDNLQAIFRKAKIDRPWAKLTTSEKTIEWFVEWTINKTLKDTAWIWFKNANADFKNIADLVTDFEIMLWKKWSKVEWLMKSVFSPQTWERTSRVFRAIRENTGIDLIKESKIAKFAMEAVWDTRAFNLLNALDLWPWFAQAKGALIQKALQSVFSPEKVAKGLTKKNSILENIKSNVSPEVKATWKEILDTLKEKGAEWADKIADQVWARSKFIDDTKDFKTVSPTTNANLIKEAKKYNTVEDFVKWLEDKWDIVYHWTNRDFEKFIPEKFGKWEWAAAYWRWVYVTPNKVEAKRYATDLVKEKWWKETIKKVVIDKNANIINIMDWIKESDYKKIVNYIGKRYPISEDWQRLLWDDLFNHLKRKKWMLDDGLDLKNPSNAIQRVIKLAWIQDAQEFSNIMKNVWIDGMIHKSPIDWQKNYVIYDTNNVITDSQLKEIFIWK